MGIKEKISNLVPKGASTKAAILLGSLGLIAGIAGTMAMETHAAAPTTSEATAQIQSNTTGHSRGQFTPPAAMGTVTAVNGSTITLTGKNGTTYTVDAGSATVEKVSTVSVSGIQTGDTLMVQGTTSGTTVTAKNIVDGQLPMGGNKQAGSSSAATGQ